MSCQTTDAVAAEFGFGTIGIEDAHAQGAAGFAQSFVENQPIGPDALGPIGDSTGQQLRRVDLGASVTSMKT